MFKVYRLKNAELFTGGGREYLTTIDGNKRALQNFVKFGGRIPTHTGELRKLPDRTGYIYYTTIGATYLFERSSK